MDIGQSKTVLEMKTRLTGITGVTLHFRYITFPSNRTPTASTFESGTGSAVTAQWSIVRPTTGGSRFRLPRRQIRRFKLHVVVVCKTTFLFKEMNRPFQKNCASANFKGWGFPPPACRRLLRSQKLAATERQSGTDVDVMWREGWWTRVCRVTGWRP